MIITGDTQPGARNVTAMTSRRDLSPVFEGALTFNHNIICFVVPVIVQTMESDSVVKMIC